MDLDCDAPFGKPCTKSYEHESSHNLLNMCTGPKKNLLTILIHSVYIDLDCNAPFGKPCTKSYRHESSHNLINLYNLYGFELRCIF